MYIKFLLDGQVKQSRIKNRKAFAAFNGIFIFLYGFWSFCLYATFHGRGSWQSAIHRSFVPPGHHTNDCDELFLAQT